MTQTQNRNNMLTNGEAIKLTSGPSVMDLMLSLFGDKTVIFKSDRQTFHVKVTSLELIERETTCWKIGGSFRLDPNQERRGECRIRFWAGLRKGVMTERDLLVIKKFSVEHLDKLSDDDLREQIARAQKLAVTMKESLQAYAKGQSEHDRLVIEARVSQILVEASFHPEMEHKLLRLSADSPAVR